MVQVKVVLMPCAFNSETVLQRCLTNGRQVSGLKYVFSTMLFFFTSEAIDNTSRVIGRVEAEVLVQVPYYRHLCRGRFHGSTGISGHAYLSWKYIYRYIIFF